MAVNTQSVRVIRQLTIIDHVPRIVGEDCHPTVSTSLPMEPSLEVEAAYAKCTGIEMNDNTRMRFNIMIECKEEACENGFR